MSPQACLKWVRLHQNPNQYPSGPYIPGLEKIWTTGIKRKKLSILCNQVWPPYALGNLKWSEVTYVQIFMALYLSNGTQKELKACVAQRDNSRKDTEDILTDPPYRVMDPSSPEVQALLAIHFIAQSDPDIRHKIQKATAGPQTPMNDLFQLAYLVFSNRDMAKKAECTQRNMQKAHVIAVALSAQRPPKEKLAFLGKSGPGRPQGPRVPIQVQCTQCGQRGHWREDCDRCVLCKQPGHWKRECPRCQRVTGAP